MSKVKFFVFSTLLSMVAVAAAWPVQEGSFRIGVRDRLEVHVDELPDLNSEQEVGEDGTITLPVIGNVVARGLGEKELAESIREKLEAEGLRRATVKVRILEFRSRPVSLLGAVAQPGNHYVPGRITLLELLTDAGGLTANHGPSIYVRRRADNGLSDQVQISAEALIHDGDPILNIPIFSGDMINIPPTREIQVHFLGEVQHVGTLSFRSTDRVTLLTAIAKAGGLSETAAKKLRIRRQGKTEEIVVDYRQVLSGRSVDPLLEDGDLIIVKEAFF